MEQVTNVVQRSLTGKNRGWCPVCKIEVGNPYYHNQKHPGHGAKRSLYKKQNTTGQDKEVNVQPKLMRAWCPQCNQRVGDATYHNQRNPGHRATKNKKLFGSQAATINKEKVHGTTASQRSSSSNSTDEHRAEVVVAYLWGKVETLINAYAQSTGISEAVIAERLRELLHRTEGGTGLGFGN